MWLLHNAQPDKQLSALHLQAKKVGFCSTDLKFQFIYKEMRESQKKLTEKCNLEMRGKKWSFYFHAFSHVYRAFWTFPKKPTRLDSPTTLSFSTPPPSSPCHFFTDKAIFKTKQNKKVVLKRGLAGFACPILYSHLGQTTMLMWWLTDFVPSSILPCHTSPS